MRRQRGCCTVLGQCCSSVAKRCQIRASLFLPAALLRGCPHTSLLALPPPATMSLFSQNGVQLNHIEKLSQQSIEASFDVALELLAHSAWQAGKLVKDGDQHVQTYKLPARTNEKLMWHMRDSEHTPEKDVPYDVFRSGLLLVSRNAESGLNAAEAARRTMQKMSTNTSRSRSIVNASRPFMKV